MDLMSALERVYEMAREREAQNPCIEDRDALNVYHDFVVNVVAEQLGVACAPDPSR